MISHRIRVSGDRLFLDYFYLIHNFLPRESSSSGKMISRRPKNLASTEYAPAPSKISAAEMTVIQNAGKSKSALSSDRIIAAALVRKMTKPPSGVKNPIKSEVPMTPSDNPSAFPKSEGFSRPNRYIQLCTKAIIPSVARSSSKPKPAVPPGNLENSLSNFVSFQ